MLMRVPHRSQPDLLAMDSQLSPVRADQAAQHLDESRFAGAVFTQKRVDLPRPTSTLASSSATVGPYSLRMERAETAGTSDMVIP